MGHWETTSVHEAPAGAEAIWRTAYADASAWPRWNPELAAASLDGPLGLGASARVRFRTGLRLRFRVTEFEEGRLFTDEARLPGARMGHRHRLEPVAGGTRLTNTIYLDGPFALLWRAIAGRRAARALPSGQAAIVKLATASGSATAGP
jgi:hypothetical protein